MKIYNIDIFFSLLIALVLLPVSQSFAQEDLNVQVKVYDLSLNPSANLSLKIDAFPSFISDEKGIAFIKIPDGAMPPKNIEVLDEALEVESWNYSRGILEIIIRKKSYRQINLSVINPEDQPLGGVKIMISEVHDNSFQTDNSGKLSLKIPLSINLSQKDLFELDGFHIVQRRIHEDDITIVATEIVKENFEDMDLASIPSAPASIKDAEDESINLDLAHLDSITSLTVMYSLMKKVNYLILDSLTKKRLDVKFKDLMGESIKDAIEEEQGVMTLINDTSVVNDDLLVVIEKIKLEEQLLNNARMEFQMFTEQIETKLKEGGQKLNLEERKQLIQLVLNLKEMLRQNEELFYKNNEVYREKLDGLLSQLANIHELEDLLSESELTYSRTKEQLIYVFFGFASFIGVIMLLTFLVKTLKNQRIQLSNANEEISRINSNLENLVAEKTQSLELINAELDTFLYRSSHNLKRPLTSIRGLASIAEFSLSRDALSLFQKVVTTTEEMEKMLDKLTMMNHVNQPVNFGVIDIENIVDNLSTQYKNTVEANKINFKINIQKDIKFKSFPIVIEIMITNLLENAFFFCRYNLERNPEVQLSFTQDAKENLIICVHDNGCGIEEEIQKKMWDMFFIGNDVSKGNGLGLFISKKAIEALNGYVKLDTIAGQYCKFTIKLPVIKKNTRVIKQNKEPIEV